MNTIHKLLGLAILGLAFALLTGCATTSSSAGEPTLVKEKVIAHKKLCAKNPDGTIDSTRCVESNQGPQVVEERLRVKMPSEYCRQYDTPETSSSYKACVDRYTREIEASAAGVQHAPVQSQQRQYYAVQPGMQSVVVPPPMFSGAPVGYGYGGISNGCGGIFSWFTGGCSGGGYSNGYNTDTYRPDQIHFGITTNR